MKNRKLNFACGRQTHPDYFCVDAQQHPKASRPVDLLHTFRFEGSRLANPLPEGPESFHEVHAYHFIEHVYRWEAPAVIAEFKRVLVHRGRMVLELPNLTKACQNLLDGSTDQFSMWPLYGDPGPEDPYNCHRWGYTPATIAALLRDAGMKDIRIMKPVTHGRKVNRDMRVECRK